MTTTAAPVEVSIHREDQALAWEVRNTGSQKLWAFLLVPSIVGGRWSFERDTAWVALEGGVVVLRKVDTPLPPRARAERVQSGAVVLSPGEARKGRIALSDPLPLSDAYQDRSGQSAVLDALALEVGWIPATPDLRPDLREADGVSFAFLEPDDAPGGQRTTRSATLRWR